MPLLVLSLLLLQTSDLPPGVATRIQNCAAVTPASARLGCFDALAKQLLPSDQATAQSPAAADAAQELPADVVVDQGTGFYHLVSCRIIGPNSYTQNSLDLAPDLKPCAVCFRKRAGVSTLATESQPASTEKPASASGSESTSGGSSSGSVHVKGYTKKDGTYVAPHTRRKPKPKS